jgi:hypothetical protein
MSREAAGARVLVFSQRNGSEIQPFRCPHFEFEDIIAQIDHVDMVAPRFSFGTKRRNLVRQLAYHSPFVLNPGVEPVRLTSSYDLFFAILGNPTDLLQLRSLGDWRSKCRKAVCLIDELWIREMDAYSRYLRMLDQFDYVILYYSQSIEPLQKYTRARCLYLAPGVDTIRFCPWPNVPERSVDVYSVGRRSAVTHKSLLHRAAREGKFYLHDSISGNRVIDPNEHRNLFANIAKRSRYFLVYPGLIDSPEIRGTQIEIGNRYFEGAASGTIMLGEVPDNAEFARMFDWPDPVIHVPYNSADLDTTIRALEKQPAIQDQMRRNNVRNSLMRHDWVYRWETILQAGGLQPLSPLTERKEKLRSLAGLVLPEEKPHPMIQSKETMFRIATVIR